MRPETQFSIWVVDLGLKARTLRSESKYESVRKVEKDLDTCEAWIRRLFEHAGQHDIHMIAYFDPILRIREDLEEVVLRVEYRKQPWWKRVAGGVLGALSTLLRMVGININLSLLLPGGSTLLLPPKRGD